MKQDSNKNYIERLKNSVFYPLYNSPKSYYIFILIALAFIIWGAYSYIIQLRFGLIVTSMNDVTIWGSILLISSFLSGSAMQEH